MQMRQLVEEKMSPVPEREDKIQFLLDRYRNMSDKSMLIYVRRFNKIGALEQELQKSLYQFERQDFLRLFQSFTNTVANGFSVLKSFVTDYLQWAEARGRKTPLGILKEIGYEDTDLTAVYKPVSYTHLDVYKRQGNGLHHFSVVGEHGLQDVFLLQLTGDDIAARHFRPDYVAVEPHFQNAVKHDAVKASSLLVLVHPLATSLLSRDKK